MSTPADAGAKTHKRIGESQPQVFIYYFTHVARPLPDLIAALEQDSTERLQADMKAAFGDVEGMLIPHPGGTDVAADIRLAVGPLTKRQGLATLPIRVEPGTPRIFVRLDANLEAADLAGGRAQLTLQGTYVPPTGPPWDVPADQSHRLAEAVMKHFVERIAIRIARNGATGPTMEPDHLGLGN